MRSNRITTDLPTITKAKTVAATAVEMSASVAAVVRVHVRTLAASAGIKLASDALKPIKTGARFVIIRPDAPNVLVSVNEALRKRDGESATVYRPATGYDTGKLSAISTETLAADFKRYGFEHLASGLTDSNRSERIREFKSGTIALRVALYSIAGKPLYIRPETGHIGSAVVKMTTADGELCFPSDPTARTSGNAYAVILPSVSAAVNAATDYREKIATDRAAKAEAKAEAKKKTAEKKAEAKKTEATAK